MLAPSLNNLAVLYQAQGRYAEAEPLYKRALAIREKALGPDHPDVGTRLNNLAGLYRAQGRYAEAEPLYQRALAIREKALGPDHPDVATVAQQPGRCCTGPRAATPRPSRSTSAPSPSARRRSAPTTPTSALALNNLAALYQAQGRYAEAEPLYQRALAIREKALGPDHPDVATVAQQPGRAVPDARAATPRPSRSIKRALAIREKALGPDHPDVGTLAQQPGRAVPRPGPLRRGRAALPSAPSPSARRRSAPTTPTSAPALNNLAAALPSPGPLRRGRAALQARARHPREGARPRPPRRRHRAQQPGRAVPGAGPLRRGRAALSSAPWRSARRRSAPTTPMSAPALNNLAVLYQTQGRYAEAEPLYKRALAIREKALGPDHPDVGIGAQQPGRAVPSPGPLRRGRAAVQARARHRREGARPRPPRCRHTRSTTWPGCTSRNATGRAPPTSGGAAPASSSAAPSAAPAPSAKP